MSKHVYEIEEINALVRVLETRSDVYSRDAVAVIVQLRHELADRQAAFMLVDECRECGEERPAYCKECEPRMFAEEEHEKTGDAHLDLAAASDRCEKYDEYLIAAGKALAFSEAPLMRDLVGAIKELVHDNNELRYAYIGKCAELVASDELNELLAVKTS